MVCKYLKLMTDIKENKRLLQSWNKNTRSHIENSQKLIWKVRKKRIDIILVSIFLTLNKFDSAKLHLPCAYINLHQNPNHNEFILETLTIIYWFKVNKRNPRTMSEICSKLTIKKPEQRYWRRSPDFIVTFEQISHIFYCWLWTSNPRWENDINWVPYLTHTSKKYMLKVNNRNTR